MRLSEAIRLGSMLTPKGIGGWMDGAERCALGAASDAAGLPTHTMEDAMSGEPRQCLHYAALAEAFPVLERIAAHPASDRMASLPLTVQDVIWSLNDCWGWTREAIADWVEAVERGILDEQDAVRNQVLNELEQFTRGDNGRH